MPTLLAACDIIGQDVADSAEGSLTAAAVIVDGTEHRRVHLTELEAALGVAGRKGAILPRNTAIDEAGRLRVVVKAYRVALAAEQRRARKANPHWVPDADQCLAVLRIVQAAEKSVALEERLRKIHREERKGYTDEQLEAVWKHNLTRAAQTMTDEEWRTMLDIRFGSAVADVLLPGRTA